ncbi:uncharacterized protein B0I36DRAFT_345385 [Microdochium trichocladiopsis]|uniref:Uncharacterized protein n=1 Tax=Microdochium trichocladiopsis TaxID=1682393 RepID=A0A9P8YE66_9PEZI|nr:uncharacterized protein B0I36DRAFT_345385 [Microdochium trichocladiopsis]KAH7037237.1 hypothetical protein B0I36DRAFT_345385 [Microdochium trichocladiopsis]
MASMDQERPWAVPKPTPAFEPPRLLNPNNVAFRTCRVSRKVARACAIAAIILVTVLVWRLVGADTYHHCEAHTGFLASALRVSNTKASSSEDPVNTFQDFKSHGVTCDVSSLELYESNSRPCQDRQSLLRALSSGGRIGKDAPYLPRGCGYLWYSTQEICEILDRFSQVVLVGDSMLRHVIGAINILIREDLGYGGVTDWNFNSVERYDIRGWAISVAIVRYPIPDVELDRLRAALKTPVHRPRAFILGHGLWNNLNHEESLAWLDTVLETVLPSLGRNGAKAGRDSENHWPVLLMTPNAAGERKPDQWLVSQGNKALVLFEERMAAEAAKRRIDHLGTWNMSIQASLYDGVHMDMRGNLVKAMMLLNWLGFL